MDYYLSVDLQAVVRQLSLHAMLRMLNLDETKLICLEDPRSRNQRGYTNWY